MWVEAGRLHRALLVIAASLCLGPPGFAVDQVRAPSRKPAAPAPAYGADAEVHPGYTSGAKNLTPEEVIGRDTWYFWTGGDQFFWRKVTLMTGQLAKQFKEKAPEANTDGTLDLLQYIDSRRRGRRFRELGVINDPGCRQAAHPDAYGLWIDECDGAYVPAFPGEAPGVMGRPSGIMGLRVFDNPEFDGVARTRWDAEQYRKDPAAMVPPYLVGMSCGVCHIGLNPINPPEDPEKPRWENLAPAIGNQYFDEGKLFNQTMSPRDFRWQVASHQPPGTSDTSRVATDHINNANAINSIFNLAARPRVPEVMNDGRTELVPHILKDGADSTGVARASLRVYVNIGMCSDYWLTLHDPISGYAQGQKPFDIETARKECTGDFWNRTERLMKYAEAFLKTQRPFHLAQAPGGAGRISEASVLKRGAQAFARECSRCHSSKPEPPELAGNPNALAEWYVSEEFRRDNFLSDDQRHPITEIGTSFARAMASNATTGHVWEQFSSRTYKELPSPGEVKSLYDPLHSGKTLSFEIPGGGRGYYRTPSLISAWATAPFFHNNSLGIYTRDPSVSGRLTAYMDAMEKLLWPEKRLGVQSIPVTSVDSVMVASTGDVLKVPANTPVDLVARIDPHILPTSRIGRWFMRHLPQSLLFNRMLKENLAPDFIEDKGHPFGSTLSDEDKRALIEYVKTL
jgi:hypothetical protein